MPAPCNAPSLRAALGLVLAVLLSACSATAPVEPVEAPPPAPTYPAWETFDPAADRADPPLRIEVVHDVPAVVMEGTVRVPGTASQPSTETRQDPPPQPPAPQPTQVEGYRVQVFSSVDRQAAERARAAAISWWQRARGTPGAPPSMEAIVAYVQPYYRVRIGAFGDRQAADDAIALIRAEYPEAFVVPDLVTVMR